MGSNYIGRGEPEVEKVLQALFPDARIFSQVPIESLIKDKEFAELSDEVKKHKFDFAVHTPTNTIVVEVNYKHGEKAAKKWQHIFVDLLVDNGHLPVTIEDYNCEYLFTKSKRLTHKKPWGPYIDVIRELERQGIHPNGTLL